ncbi:MAG: hypothetical protein RIC93_14210 [Alphaproteobacteria bacterium]
MSHCLLPSGSRPRSGYSRLFFACVAGAALWSSVAMAESEKARPAFANPGVDVAVLDAHRALGAEASVIGPTGQGGLPGVVLWDETGRMKTGTGGRQAGGTSTSRISSRSGY